MVSINSSPSRPSADQPALQIKRKHSFKAKVTSNIPQKLIALVCSLILFCVVVGDRNKTLDFEKIPVELRMPDGFVAVDEMSQTTVDVSISGRTSLLRDIRRDDLGIIQISPPPREGNIQMTLQADMISLPEGIHVDHFTPEFLSINLEPLETREVAVSTDHAFTGELLPSYQLGEVRIQPETIEISGPRSKIMDINQLFIEPIDLTGKASTFTVNRWVINNRVGIQTKSTQVEVTVNILSKSRQHVVLSVPIIPLNLKLNHEFTPSTIDLTLVGDEDALNKIDSSKLFITIDASSDNDSNSHARLLSGQDFTVPNLPAGVTFDVSKVPTVLFKVWPDTEIKPELPSAKPATEIPSAPANPEVQQPHHS
ncbi:MAG: YbbR-like domain-containing protein [Proteobacteria bacterium]|nr:YbbR-like domain-containing protein [Pseudomonadota bacterium]